MKVILASIALAGAGLAFSGCETDMPPDTNKPTPSEKLGRGLTGHGTIVPVDKARDPMIQGTSGPATPAN